MKSKTQCEPDEQNIRSIEQRRQRLVVMRKCILMMVIWWVCYGLIYLLPIDSMFPFYLLMPFMPFGAVALLIQSIRKVNPGDVLRGLYVHYLVTIINLAWIVFLSIYWELFIARGFDGAINVMLRASVYAIPGFGVGFLLRRGLRDFDRKPVSEWLMLGGVFLLSGILLWTAYIYVVFMIIAFGATG